LDNKVRIREKDKINRKRVYSANHVVSQKELGGEEKVKSGGDSFGCKK